MPEALLFYMGLLAGTQRDTADRTVLCGISDRSLLCISCDGQFLAAAVVPVFPPITVTPSGAWASPFKYQFVEVQEYSFPFPCPS